MAILFENLILRVFFVEVRNAAVCTRSQSRPYQGTGGPIYIK